MDVVASGTVTRALLIVDDIVVDEANDPMGAGRLALAAGLTLHRYEDYGRPGAWYVEHREYERGTDRPIGERPVYRCDVLRAYEEAGHRV